MVTTEDIKVVKDYIRKLGLLAHERYNPCGIEVMPVAHENYSIELIQLSDAGNCGVYYMNALLCLLPYATTEDFWYNIASAERNDG